MSYLVFFGGMVVGTFFGVLIMGLMIAAREGECKEGVSG